jgi:hypothetical protein
MEFAIIYKEAKLHYNYCSVADGKSPRNRSHPLAAMNKSIPNAGTLYLLNVCSWRRDPALRFK